AAFTPPSGIPAVRLAEEAPWQDRMRTMLRLPAVDSVLPFGKGLVDPRQKDLGEGNEDHGEGQQAHECRGEPGYEYAHAKILRSYCSVGELQM
ncbi:hypothetical protein ACWDAZ_38725, partial [Streptomyces sp. NPDC001215]